MRWYFLLSIFCFSENSRRDGYSLVLRLFQKIRYDTILFRMLKPRKKLFWDIVTTVRWVCWLIDSIPMSLSANLKHSFVEFVVSQFTRFTIHSPAVSPSLPFSFYLRLITRFFLIVKTIITTANTCFK